MQPLVLLVIVSMATVSSATPHKMATRRELENRILELLDEMEHEKNDQPSSRGVSATCDSPVDVLLLLDDSRSIWGRDFRDMLNFCESLVARFHISDSGVHVGAAAFSEGAHGLWRLGEYNTVEETQQALQHINQSRGSYTETWFGLQFAREAFTTGREGVPHLLIVITDGVSSDRDLTLTQAQEVKAAGIEIIVIGVGELDKEQLTELASPPVAQHFFLVHDFQALSGIEAKVAGWACKGSNEKPQAQKVCQAVPAEIALILDHSTSIHRQDFLKQLDFTADLVAVFDVSPSVTRVAAVSFSTEASLEFHLDEFSSKDDVIARIHAITQIHGNTETSDALELVREEVMTSQHGVRQDVAHVVIVVTDGRSQRTRATQTQAALLKDSGATVFAIGVGGDTDSEELQNIASEPSTKYVFHVDDFDAIHSIKDSLAIRACESTSAVSRKRDRTWAW